MLVPADTHEVVEDSVALFMASLPFRRLWNIAVLAQDCENHTLAENIEIGINKRLHNNNIYLLP